MNKHLYLLIWIFLLALPCNASTIDTVQVKVTQEVQYDKEREVSPISLDEETLEDFKNDKDYDYTENKEETWWDKFKAWLGNIWRSFWEWLLGDYEASPFWSFFIELLPYLIIAGLIGFIVWVFIKLNPGFTPFRRKDSPQVFLTEEEEIIKSKNIRELIQLALQEKNYRLAVRYYYLLALQQLSEAHIIEYEFDKTNHDYAKEIKVATMTSSFHKVTNLYDYIWYGNFEVDAADFEKAKRSFEKLETQIPKS